MKPYRVILLVTIWSLYACGRVAIVIAIDFVVPADSTNVDGNTYSVVPFHSETYRYQQVYAATEFSRLTNSGGGWLVDIVFRADATNGHGFAVKIPNMQINLSTTPRGPDELSPVFAENVGADEQVAFAGYVEASGGGGDLDGPEPFSFLLRLSKVFFYDPKLGNLLLDIRIVQGNTNITVDAPTLEAWNRTNDSISRVYWGNVNAACGLVDTAGLVSELFFWPNPTLNFQQQSNALVFTWLEPPGFVNVETILETAPNLAPRVQWQSVTNGIVQSNFVNSFSFPLDSAGKEAYFRLVSTETSQPP